jgi:hypothetical protein
VRIRVRGLAKLALASLRHLNPNFAYPLIRSMIIRGEVLGMMMFDAVDMPGRFDSSAGERYIRNFHSRTWKEANASLG